MTTPANISSRMSQPWFMRGREYRRDGVPTFIVDGSAWPPKPVDGDDAWALFCASADGDLDQARRLIDGEPNLVHAQIWYAKPIDVAMREGHLEIMKAMLDADEQRWLFDHTREWCYRTTESELRRRGFDELVEYRNSWKASLAPNFRPEIDELREIIKRDKATSWEEHEASNAKVIAAVDADRTLMQATDRRGLTLLHMTLEAQNLLLTTALLERDAPLDTQTVHGWTPLDFAVDHFPAAVPLLFQRGVEPTLDAMIACGLTDDLGTQLQADASDINKLGVREKTSLTRARANELLVEYGALDPDENDFAKVPQEVVELVYPVHWIESVEAIESWAKHYGPERLKDLWWGLGPHSRPGREAMETLVRYGHDVNRTDWWGRTLLQAEAANGNLDRAKMLLDLGADLHSIDVQGHTNALGYAARNGQVEMVKFFLEQGADKNPEVPTWAKPLTYAKDYLADHATRYSEKDHGQSRLNGHRTNQPTSAYEEVIQLLS